MIGAQQQRIPLATLDQKQGVVFITKEWLKILDSVSTGAAADLTALVAALNAAIARIGTLELQMLALTARVAALEALDTGDSLLLQPSPVLVGPQGDQGEQGEPGECVFPPPLTPIPLEWPEDLRSQLELSGLY